MATKEATKVLRIPGDLFKNPTDPDAGFNDDGTPKAGLGTPLGYSEDIAVLIGQRIGTVESQMDNAVVSKNILFTTCLILVFQRDLDPDVYSLVYGSNLSEDTDSTKPLVTLKGGEIFTQKEKDNSAKILLVPQNKKGEVPGYLFYNCACWIEQGSRNEYEPDKDWGNIIAFEGMLDNLEQLMQFGYLQDFSV